MKALTQCIPLFATPTSVSEKNRISKRHREKKRKEKNTKNLMSP